MPDKEADTAIAQQVELTIGRLDSLSTLPCVIAQFFSKLQRGQFSPSALADIIESDPSFMAKILSLIGEQRGESGTGGRFSLRQGLGRLAAGLVRDAIFSVKVFSSQGEGGDFRKQLVLHSLAVACCAKDIADITLPQVDSQLAYCAGLLHDVGKFALEEAMPKSFVRIVEEAKSQNAGVSAIEQKYLGTDHSILGKRLAQKWRFPKEVALAVWLHHSDTVTIYRNMPEARMAAIVQLADSVARKSGIGQSGSYDSPKETGPIADVLGVDIEQLQQILQGLAEQVEQKSKVLGLDFPDPLARCIDTVHGTAARLAGDNIKLTDENRRLQTASSHLDFVTEFLLGVNSSARAVSIAEKFATRWQEFYQTGRVCLYLAPGADSRTLEAVVVENLSQSETVILNAPADTPAIPEAIANKFALLDAHDYVDWLFEQLDAEFESSRTKLAPLLSNGRAVGAIVFELHWPGDLELFEEKLRIATSTAGAVLDMAAAWQRQERFAEGFARFISKPAGIRSGIVTESLLGALAEMAAGAAHELNNPLSVISGRAQLLAEAETDKEKKRIIDQIKRNAGQISQIIDDLMNFAEPPKPRPTRTDIRQIIDESVQLTSQKTKAEHINTQIEIADGAVSVFVDSAQVVSAVANIITNAVEAYTAEQGLIEITAEPTESGDFVKLTIKDSGCGMDAKALQKAAHPFFSAKEAGRKRGMGLAHAFRFIQLNGGSMEIASEPGRGTAVTIFLPCG